MIKISPSILACDFNRIGEETSAMKAAGVEMLHLDVMDGHFVPNITFGPPVIASLRKASDLFFDVHLMMSKPLDYIETFVKSGADMITFHIESESDPAKTIEAIKSYGVKSGIAMRPDTPADTVEAFISEIDMVLAMTVEPGFGGQKFREYTLAKIAAIRALANKLNPNLDIEVDGGIDVKTAALVARSGANVLVAGSSLFSQADYTKAVKEMRLSAEMSR